MLLSFLYLQLSASTQCTRTHTHTPHTHTDAFNLYGFSTLLETRGCSKLRVEQFRNLRVFSVDLGTLQPPALLEGRLVVLLPLSPRWNGKGLALL